MYKVVILLLLLPMASALFVENTQITGTNTVIYGDLVAYERSGMIHLYNVATKEDIEISPGNNPSLFAFTLAFETKETDIDLNSDGDFSDTIIQFVNVKGLEIINTRAAGKNPFVFSSGIVFSTNEADLGVDFSNDGDTSDDIIRGFDFESEKITNFKAVGDFPVLHKDYVAILTEESQLGFDLNADNDLRDKIVRVLDRNSHKVSNTREEGSEFSFDYQTGFASFISDDEIVVLDVREQKITNLEQPGSSPSISKGRVVFSKDDKLFSFSLTSEGLVDLNVEGTRPSIFEHNLIFFSSGILHYAFEEDGDDDSLYDFSDNCPTLSEMQEDSDEDGVGDACDGILNPIKKKKKEANLTVNEVEEEPAEETGSWLWYIFAALVAFVLVYVFVIYREKKRKSFGF